MHQKKCKKLRKPLSSHNGRSNKLLRGGSFTPRTLGKAQNSCPAAPRWAHCGWLHRRGRGIERSPEKTWNCRVGEKNGLICSSLSRRPLQDAAVCSSAQSQVSRIGFHPQSRSRGRWVRPPDSRASVCSPSWAVVREPASSWSSCSGGDEAGRTPRSPSGSGHRRKKQLWKVKKTTHQGTAVFYWISILSFGLHGLPLHFMASR